MQVKDFELLNDSKVERALNGVPQADGTSKGGIANEDGTFDEDKLLCEYDKLGGCIKRGGDKLKSGCFYDFKKRKPRVIPQLAFSYRVNGREIEVPEGAELPGIVKAAKLLAEEDEEKPKRGRKAK